MKTFKLSIKEGGLNAQLKWLGALMLAIAITIAAVGAINYLKVPQELENGYTPRDLVIQEFYVAVGVFILGLIFLIGGVFAHEHKNKKQ